MSTESNVAVFVALFCSSWCCSSLRGVAIGGGMRCTSLAPIRCTSCWDLDAGYYDGDGDAYPLVLFESCLLVQQSVSFAHRLRAHVEFQITVG
jgi:hypothetical protein